MKNFFLALLIVTMCSVATCSETCAAKPEPEPSIEQVKPVRPKEAQPTLTEEQTAANIAELRAKHLELPISGFNVESIKGSFDEAHFGAKHGASDMLAPRNTPIRAVEDGTVVKLFLSKAGGNTIYQADPTGKYVYYYAHLEKYADNLKDGDKVKKGQIIGYVGTSGNAPPDTPHLHMGIGVGDAMKKWWNVADLDPYEVFK